jgi:hypothetical protein
MHKRLGDLALYLVALALAVLLGLLTSGPR